MLHFWTDVGNVCIWGTAIVLFLALILYTAIDHWGWAKNWAGRVIVGLAATIIVIYVPSLIALADPAFTGFGTKQWYQWTAIGTVIFSFVIAVAFVATLLYVWRLRRRIRDNGG